MIYCGYTTEIALAYMALWLYNTKKLNLELEKIKPTVHKEVFQVDQ
jgi:hypothetical protein